MTNSYLDLVKQTFNFPQEGDCSGRREPHLQRSGPEGADRQAWYANETHVPAQDWNADQKGKEHVRRGI